MGPYTRSYGVSSYSPYVSTYGYGLRTLGKRSADAEPEADADAYYYGNYGYGSLGYSSLGYSNLGYSSLPYTGSYGVRSYSPYVSTYGYGLRTLGKRSADAEPEAEADADAYYYGNYGY